MCVAPRRAPSYVGGMHSSREFETHLCHRLLVLFYGGVRHVNIHSLTVRAKFNLRPYVKYGFHCTDFLRNSQAHDGILCKPISNSTQMGQ